MRSELDRDSGVTYIGPRAFVAGFAIVCLLFMALLYGAKRYAESLEALPPIAVDVRTAPAANAPTDGFFPNAQQSATPSPIASALPRGSSTPATVAAAAAGDAPIALASPLARPPLSPRLTQSVGSSAAGTTLVKPTAPALRPLQTPSAVAFAQSGTPDNLASPRRFTPRALVTPLQLGPSAIETTSRKPKSALPLPDRRARPASLAAIAIGNTSRPIVTAHATALRNAGAASSVRSMTTAVALPRTVPVHETVAHVRAMRWAKIVRSSRARDANANLPRATRVTPMSQSPVVPGLLVPFKASSTLSPNAGLEPRIGGQAPLIVRPTPLR